MVVCWWYYTFVVFVNALIGSNKQGASVKFFNHAKIFIHEDISIARVTARAEQNRLLQPVVHVFKL
jgi:hypothetical protein